MSDVPILFGFLIVDDPNIKDKDKDKDKIDLWLSPICPKEVRFTADVVRIMNKFNFNEACRRVICGNKDIRRAEWANKTHLSFKIRDAMFLISNEGQMTFLKDEDINATDWIDPGE